MILGVYSMSEYSLAEFFSLCAALVDFCEAHSLVSDDYDKIRVSFSKSDSGSISFHLRT